MHGDILGRLTVSLSFMAVVLWATSVHAQISHVIDGTTHPELASARTCRPTDISADGRYVLIRADIPAATPFGNGRIDYFRWDTTTNVLRPFSFGTATAGAAKAAMSDDGSKVVLPYSNESDSTDNFLVVFDDAIQAPRDRSFGHFASPVGVAGLTSDGRTVQISGSKIGVIEGDTENYYSGWIDSVNETVTKGCQIGSIYDTSYYSLASRDALSVGCYSLYLHAGSASSYCGFRSLNEGSTSTVCSDIAGNFGGVWSSTATYRSSVKIRYYKRPRHTSTSIRVVEVTTGLTRQVRLGENIAYVSLVPSAFTTDGRFGIVVSSRAESGRFAKPNLGKKRAGIYVFDARTLKFRLLRTSPFTSTENFQLSEDASTVAFPHGKTACSVEALRTGLLP